MRFARGPTDDCDVGSRDRGSRRADAEARGRDGAGVLRVDSRHRWWSGIEATGSMGWFLRLLEELGITCRVGHPAPIRKAETRRQKHDRRDADLLLKLLVEDRFPAIWMPSTELRDLRALLLHRHQWVRMRTRVQNALQAIALGHGLRRGHDAVESRRPGDARGVAAAAARRASPRVSSQALYQHLDAQVDQLDDAGDSRRSGAAAARDATHDASRRRAGHGVGDRGVPRRSRSRFADGKALASYVGMIPSEYSSGVPAAARWRSANKATRCCAFSGERRRCMPCGAIPSCSASTGASCSRRASAKRASPPRASSGFGSGSCCAIRSITRSSAVAAHGGSRDGDARAGMPVWVVVLCVSDRQTD